MNTLARPLIPLDGSTASSVSLHYYKPLIEHAESVFLLHAVDPDPSPSMMIADDHGGLFLGSDEHDGPAAREYLKRIAGEAGFAERADYLVEAGQPAEVILHAAKREEASIIVMATHGGHGLEQWALGTQTERVLRASHVPVLVVPSPLRRSRPLPDSVRHMLVPIDGSDRALELAPHVAAVAKRTKARVTLTHCIRRNAAAEEQGREYLYRARCAFEDLGLLPRTRVVRAPPAQGIVEYALPALDDDIPVDMIAMTTHGRSGMARWALGSVTERVMRHTTLPLLVVRSEA